MIIKAWERHFVEVTSPLVICDSDEEARWEMSDVGWFGLPASCTGELFEHRFSVTILFLIL